MGILESIPFEEEAEDIKERVEGYWTKRAESFYEQRCFELRSGRAVRWLFEISNATDDRKNMKILDVGCGAGYFEVLLGREGHEITGIDLTPEMIDRATTMIHREELDLSKVSAMVMDAEKPDFPDETFDLIVTRNLTWTLPHPIDAYREWFRVLKKGGILLNFDAEYAKGAHTLNQDENIVHKFLSNDMHEENHAIYHMLTISTLDRPDWDTEVLREIGFSAVEADKDFGSRIYVERDELFMPDKMFMIKAVK